MPMWELYKNHNGVDDFIIIATTSLWSFAYFVYWYTGVNNFDEIYTWIEIEWLIPIFITILLLIFGTVVNMEAQGLYKKHKERLANNENKEWLLLIWYKDCFNALLFNLDSKGINIHRSHPLSLEKEMSLFTEYLESYKQNTL